MNKTNAKKEENVKWVPLNHLKPKPFLKNPVIQKPEFKEYLVKYYAKSVD